MMRTQDRRSYTISYQYNAANQLTQLSYPSGRECLYGRDAKGPLTSIGSFLTVIRLQLPYALVIWSLHVVLLWGLIKLL